MDNWLKDCVVYDVEIAREVDSVPGKWDNPEGMGFASAVTYSYADDQYRFWLGPDNRKPLCDFLEGRVAVTFNGIRFDSRVLLGNEREVDSRGVVRRDIPLSDGGWEAGCWWLNCDLLLEYIKARFGDPDVGTAEKRLGDRAIHDGSFSLDGLSEGTLDLHKTGHGANAPILYQKGLYSDLLSYNLQDVRLTRKLFEFIREHGFCVDRKGRVVRIRLQ